MGRPIPDKFHVYDYNKEEMSQFVRGPKHDPELIELEKFLVIMTQKTIETFRNENYSKPPKNNFATNKTGVYHNDDKFSNIKRLFQKYSYKFKQKLKLN